MIHGDPHLGNYTGGPEGATGDLNLLDFGCIRIFPPRFVAGVVRLYRALSVDDRAERSRPIAAGIPNLTDELVEVLNVWARFIYGPLLDDRVRTGPTTSRPAACMPRGAFKVTPGPKAGGSPSPASSCSWTAPPSAWARPSCT